MSGAFHKAIEWTPERVALLRKLVNEGLSGPQIALKLGTTRQAISGKIKRLGLSIITDGVPRVVRPNAPKKLTVSPDRFCHNLTDPNRADKLLRRFSWETEA